MELQKRLQVKRERYESILREFINKKTFKLGYSYNQDSVFLWGDESVISELKCLVGN
jgi:hypothetical protein